MSFVLLVFLAATWHFWMRRPVGHGPAGPAVARAAFQRVWSDRPVLLVGLGDSVTAGFGARPGYSYFDRLVANPPDEFPDLLGVNLSAVFPRLRATNLAVSGSTSSHPVRGQLSKLAPQPADVFGLVVITTGGNDLLHNYGRTPPSAEAMYGATREQAGPWIEDFKARLDVLLSTVRGRFPGGCRIFLANIYDPTDGVGDIQWAGLPRWREGLELLATYNRLLAEAAGRNADVHLVDIRSAFLGHGIHANQPWRSFHRSADPHYWFHENLEDPNERGYDALRRLFLNEMIAVLAGGTNPVSAP